MKRFLRPVIGVASAVAVGVGATFVGIQFAGPEVVRAPGVQVDAPVLAPVTTDDELSTVVGTETITLPGTAPTQVPDDLAELIDTISDAEDPALAITEYEETEPTATASDPCADGSADDCPAGMHSTILALEGVRDLYVAAMAFPPTQAEYEATSSNTMHPWCPTTEFSDTEAPFGLFSTTPASYFISYWPSDNPADSHVASARSTDEARAAYAAGQAAGVDMFELPMQRSCVTLTDLEPNTAYTASVYAVDMFDRSASARQTWFNSGGPLGVPGPEISTLGDNIVFAHALHTDDERVVIQGIMATDTVPEPTCDATPMPSAVLAESESSVSDEYLLDRGVLPEYVRRANASFILPEGATFIICVRVYPAADGDPSWQTSHPAKESRIVVLAPDVVRPVITVESLDIQRGSLVTMSTSTVEGIPCGAQLDTARPGGRDIPFTLCDPALVTGTVVLADELRNYGYSGEIVMNSSITPQAGVKTVRQAVMDLGVHPCTPACPDPAELRYRMALGPEGSVETAQIHVSWEQGRTNGAAGWQVSPIETVSPEYVVPDYPDFDRNAALDDFQIDWEAKNVDFTYALTADRPVDYTVTITDPLLDHYAACVDGPGGSVLTLSGRAENAATLRFSGLCLGAAYNIDVTLTDDDGTTKRYARTFSGGSEFVDLGFTTPGWDGELVWQLHVAGPDHSALTGFTASVAGVRLLPEGLWRTTICEEDGVIDLEGTTEVSLSQDSLVAVGGDWSLPTSWAAEGCRATASIAHRTSVWQVVSIDDIQWGAATQGVWIHMSDGYGTSLHLWMDDFR